MGGSDAGGRASFPGESYVPCPPNRIPVDASTMRGQTREQVVDLAGREADAIQRVLGPKLLQDLRQRRLVPARQLVGAVVCDLVGRSLEVAAVEPDHRHMGEPERLGGLQAGVAGDDLARASSDDRLLPVEATDRGGDVLDGSLVHPRVGGGEGDPLDRNPFDGQGCSGHTDSLRPAWGGSSGRAWSWWHRGRRPWIWGPERNCDEERERFRCSARGRAMQARRKQKCTSATPESPEGAYAWGSIGELPRALAREHRP